MFNFSHRFVYAMLSCLYAALGLGLDKSLTMLLIAFAYALLGLARGQAE